MIQIYEMIFPQTVNCWVLNATLDLVASVLVGGLLGSSSRTRRQTRKTRAQAPDMWIETRARTTFNGSERCGGAKEEPKIWCAARKASSKRCTAESKCKWCHRDPQEVKDRHKLGEGIAMKEAMGRRLDDKKTREDLSQEDLCVHARLSQETALKRRWRRTQRVFTNVLRGSRRQGVKKQRPHVQTSVIGRRSFRRNRQHPRSVTNWHGNRKQVEIRNGRTEKKSWRSNRAGRHHTTGTVEGRMRNE